VNHGIRMQGSLLRLWQIARIFTVKIFQAPIVFTFRLIKLTMLLSSSWS
jgi:hypothetical protein